MADAKRRADSWEKDLRDIRGEYSKSRDELMHVLPEIAALKSTNSAKDQKIQDLERDLARARFDLAASQKENATYIGNLEQIQGRLSAAEKSKDDAGQKQGYVSGRKCISGN